MEAAVNGGVIGYDVVGSGPPLVLCHGGEADASMFDALIPHLQNSFTVIAYDQRDTGRTKFPEQHYTMADLADDVAALIEDLGFERAHVFGQSYGSLIAQEVAVRHPESVDRLVLSVSVSTASLAQPMRSEVIELATKAAGGDTDAAMKLPTLMFSPGATVARPELMAELARIRVDRSVEAQARRQMVPTEYSSVARPGRFEQFDRPALVLTGFGDQMVDPSEAWALAQEFPNATLVALPGVGHLWPIESPSVGAIAVRAFLRAQQ